MAKQKPTVEDWTIAAEAHLAGMRTTLLGRVRYIATAKERHAAAVDLAEQIVEVAEHLPNAKKKGG